jgi:hypothetical protein
MIEIKNRFNEKIMYAGNYRNVKELIIEENIKDLRHADLRYSDLTDADLRYSDLTDADLLFADLSNSDLRYADLPKNYKYLDLNGSKHRLKLYSDRVLIGCENHSLEFWLLMYDTIGKENDYTEEQINEYKKYLDFCKSL